MHVITHVRSKTTPYPEYTLLTTASEHGLQAVRDVISNFENRNIYMLIKLDSDVKALTNSNRTITRYFGLKYFNYLLTF